MGQNMGQKCGLAMGQPNRQLSPPNLDLRRIQDHFGFSFPRVALTGFSRGFSLPVFKPSADTERFSSSASNLLPRLQHGSKTWVRLFLLPRSREPVPTQGVVIVPQLSEIASSFFSKGTAAGRHHTIPPDGS